MQPINLHQNGRKSCKAQRPRHMLHAKASPKPYANPNLRSYLKVCHRVMVREQPKYVREAVMSKQQMGITDHPRPRTMIARLRRKGELLDAALPTPPAQIRRALRLLWTLANGSRSTHLPYPHRRTMRKSCLTTLQLSHGLSLARTKMVKTSS